jgi:putative endonuclease
LSEHIILGEKGEELSLNFLKKLDYTILQTNWRYQKAEIDIIAKHSDFIIFIEVKTRKSDFFGKPEQSINNKKEDLYKLAAEAYLVSFNLENEIRFDVISIILNSKQSEIEHFINAF